jgi:hypothetical protein
MRIAEQAETGEQEVVRDETTKENKYHESVYQLVWTI